VFPMLKRWTLNAARSISSAQAIAQSSWGHEKAAPAGTAPFVVLGMGRLGLSEFDLASDADLIFVAGAEAKREDLDHWTRLAEKMIEVLSSYTRDGTLFPVDTRLRPRGQEGELVVTLEGFLNYIAENSQAWELLTYLKAHPLAGNPQFSQEAVDRLQSAIFHRFSTYGDFEAELHQMRRRLERQAAVASSNTKTVPGGYYDVDFAVSYLRLRCHMAVPPGANLAEQIATLQAAGGLSSEDAAALTQGAGFLRAVDHIFRLVAGKAPSSLPANGAHADMAATVARRWSLTADGQTLAGKLQETQEQLRRVYRRLVGSD